RVAPLHTYRRLARLVAHFESATAAVDGEDHRLARMLLRQRPRPEGREKLRLVEEVAENALEPSGRNGAKNASTIGAIDHELGEMRPPSQEPLEPPPEIVELAIGVRCDDVDSEKGNEADDRADGQMTLGVVVGEDVEVKTLVLVPRGKVGAVRM